MTRARPQYPQAQNRKADFRSSREGPAQFGRPSGRQTGQSDNLAGLASTTEAYNDPSEAGQAAGLAGLPAGPVGFFFLFDVIGVSLGALGYRSGQGSLGSAVSTSRSPDLIVSKAPEAPISKAPNAPNFEISKFPSRRGRPGLPSRPGRPCNTGLACLHAFVGTNPICSRMSHARWPTGSP